MHLGNHKDTSHSLSFIYTLIHSSVPSISVYVYILYIYFNVYFEYNKLWVGTDSHYTSSPGWKLFLPKNVNNMNLSKPCYLYYDWRNGDILAPKDSNSRPVPWVLVTPRGPSDRNVRRDDPTFIFPTWPLLTTTIGQTKNFCEYSTMYVHIYSTKHFLGLN